MFSGTAVGQTTAAAVSAAPASVAKPNVNAVGGIELGMTAKQVKEKLGKAEVEDATGLVFDLDNGVSMQIGLDEDKKVRTVAATYPDASKGAPSITDIFGSSVEKSDGDVYKMERYPEAGFWISYSRTNSKEKPMTIIMMRKID